MSADSEGGFLPLYLAYKLLPTMNDYTKQSKALLNKVGDHNIFRIIVFRKPVQEFVNKTLNAMTLGQWEKAVKEKGYDQVFHLYMVVWLASPDGTVKHVLIEKNEIVNIQYASSSDFRYYDTYTSYKNVFKPSTLIITLNDLLNKTKGLMGDDRYWKYNAFTNNCQVFIKYILDANNLLTPELLDFIDQKAEQIANTAVSQPVQMIVNTTTNLASKLRRLKNYF